MPPRQSKADVLRALRQAVWTALTNHEFGQNLNPPLKLKKAIKNFIRSGFSEEQAKEEIAKELAKFYGEFGPS